MFIGTKASSTILEVLQIGVSELIRRTGIPSDVMYTSPYCDMQIQSAEMDKRVDRFRVEFHVKPEVDLNCVEQALQEARIPSQVRIMNGKCSIAIPAFEWRQLPRLLPLDRIVEGFALHTLRSQSWKVVVESYKRHDVNINVLIEIMKQRNASDLHLRAGSPAYIRVDNDLMPLDMPPLSAQDMEEIIFQLGSEEELQRLQAERETSFQFHAAGLGYLRCSSYFKQGAMALAIRIIPEEPLPFESLNIPETVRSVCDKQRGLFLVCGTTGSGKSTTLAAMVDYINQTRHANIITIEDPIEYVYRDRKSIIAQRQVGRDTFSFANGLKGALREDPDVILVGEMRDLDTIRAALSAAETGHLVFSTLHTMTAVDTVNRVISFFPQAERDLIRQELAYTLQGVVCQRLLKRIGGGRIPCLEILIGNKPIVREAILEGDIGRLYSILEVDSDMKSFDQYAVELYQKKLVTKEVAISACSNEEAFERITSGIKSSEGRKILG